MTTGPTVSIPCGFTQSGLPVGIQIVGKPRGEAQFLSFARQFEESLGIYQRLPIQPQRWNKQYAYRRRKLGFIDKRYGSTTLLPLNNPSPFGPKNAPWTKIWMLWGDVVAPHHFSWRQLSRHKTILPSDSAEVCTLSLYLQNLCL